MTAPHSKGGEVLPIEKQLTRGPCAKREVVCTITYGPDREDFVIGRNDCANPQAACPRAPGEGYEKCKTICRQGGHAEIEALRAAKALGVNLGFAHVHIHGHYWMCEDCGRQLYEAGVRHVTLVLSAPR